MKRIQLKAFEMMVAVGGQGTPMLLVHGFPLDNRMWRHQFDHFQTGYQVIAPDLRGFGKSGPLEVGASMGSFAEELLEMLDVLEINEPAIVCGSSMGGYIVWQLAHRWPNRFSHFILCNTRAAADPVETARARRIAAQGVLANGSSTFIQEQIKRLVSETTQIHNPDVIDLIQEIMAATNPLSIAGALIALAERPDATPWLAEITKPTLVIAAEDDLITPPAEMRAFAELITNKKFVEISEAGHLSPLEQPQAVNQVIQDFLQATS